MKLLERIYVSFSRICPPAFRKSVQILADYSGKEINAEAYLGRACVFALLAITMSIFIPKALFGEYDPIYIIFGSIAGIMIIFFYYMSLYFTVEERTKQIEESLPDSLALMAANIKAGMTPYHAMKLSARKEFGPLSDEINNVTTKALGTDSFSKLLLKMTKRTSSKVLERTMKLFVTSIKAGGKLGGLLEEIAKDIAETANIKKELVTSTKTYSAFILFIVVIGTPLLLSISVNFIDMITTMQSKSTVSAGFGMSALVGTINITSDFMTKVAIILLILTPTSASVLIGVITEGKPKNGLKIAPFLIAACLIIFFICKHFVAGFLKI